MKRSKIVAIIQARLSSTRLKGKVLLDLGGKPVLQHVIERAQAIPGVDEVVVAIPRGKTDAPLKDFVERFSRQSSEPNIRQYNLLPTGEDLAKRSTASRMVPPTIVGRRGSEVSLRLHYEGRPRVSVFTGSENDVLDRYYQAARASKATVVLRITSDCPLIDPDVSARVLKALASERADYASNIIVPTFPDGLDVEAMRFEALHSAWKSAKKSAEREHVTSFIRNHPDRFKQASVTNDQDLSQLRWTIDEPRDLEFLAALYQRLNGNSGTFRFNDILEILRREPELSKINGDIRPNEGYYRSLLKEKPIPAKKLRLSKSLDHYKQVQEIIPGCSQTFTKAPNQFVRGVSPLFLQRGRGCRVWDVDGNEFIDTTMGLAPVSLGYADPDVNAAVRKQLDSGTTLSQPHPLELKVAQLLKEIIPCAEMVRFGKNGSDVTAAAVRIARAHTGRDVIAAGGYHGWQDWFIATTTRNRGIPEATRKLTAAFQYNRIDSLKKIFDEHPGQVAGVILEPIGVEEPKDGFLQQAAELTRRNGAVLIFDEVVTGFRLALGGAQQHYGITPDLACFGKAMANGFPLSAIVGRAGLMRLFEEVFFSFTFGGELLSLTASAATIEKMRRESVIAHMWKQGRKLQDGYNTMAREVGLDAVTRCVGLPPHTVITFKTGAGEDWWDLKSLFQQECVRRGFLFMGMHNPSLAHKDADIDQILRVYSSALRAAADTVRQGPEAVQRRLDGPPVEPVFRKA